MENLNDLLRTKELFRLKVNSWLVRFQEAFKRKDNEQLIQENACFILQLLNCEEIIYSFPEVEKRNVCNFIISISELLADEKELHKFVAQILKKQDTIVSFPTDAKLLIVKRILEILRNITDEEALLYLGDLFFKGQTLEKFGYSCQKPNPIVDTGEMGLLRNNYSHLNALKNARETHNEINSRKKTNY